MNAIIAGASGLVGRSLLNDLLSRDRYERVIALVRSDLGLSSSKLSTARVDFAALDSTAPGDACGGADLFARWERQSRKRAPRTRFDALTTTRSSRSRVGGWLTARGVSSS